MDTYKVELTDKAKKAMKKLAGKNKELFAEVHKKIEQFAKGNYELLDLKPIIRKSKKNKIKEIRIKSPGSYRVFYIHISEENNSILIVDGREKKIRKFSFSYFDTLDQCIEEHFNKK